MNISFEKVGYSPNSNAIRRNSLTSVSGGTSGCVIAGRLAEDPNAKILVLEAGPDNADLENVHMAGGSVYPFILPGMLLIARIDGANALMARQIGTSSQSLWTRSITGK
jgi:hypothetical protein